MDAENKCFFALDADPTFGERISEQSGVPLNPHEVRQFEDGEHKIRPLVSVQDKNVFVLHSLYGDDLLSADDKLCRLLFFIACLKDACAARVTALVPYLAYSRKDRKTQLYDPVTTQYVARLFEAVGTDAVVTIDVHNLAAFQNAFRCRTEHLEANPIFVAHIAALVADAEVTVVSPDAGGMKRAEQFRQALSILLQRPVGTGMMEKYRALGAVTGEALVGEMQGRVAVIIDDLISSGTTMQRGNRLPQRRGVHGLCGGDARLADRRCQRSAGRKCAGPGDHCQYRSTVSGQRCAGIAEIDGARLLKIVCRCYPAHPLEIHRCGDAEIR